MSSSKTPQDAQVNGLLELLDDAQVQPLYVHCHYGKDRTGLIMGLHRVLYQGWTADRAYQEMRDIGFNPILTKLKNYFKKRTGSKILDAKDLNEFFPSAQAASF